MSKPEKPFKSVYKRYHVILEQHGAVGWAGLEEYLNKTSRQKYGHLSGNRSSGKISGRNSKAFGINIDLCRKA